MEICLFFCVLFMEIKYFLCWTFSKNQILIICSLFYEIYIFLHEVFSLAYWQPHMTQVFLSWYMIFFYRRVCVWIQEWVGWSERALHAEWRGTHAYGVIQRFILLGDFTVLVFLCHGFIYLVLLVCRSSCRVTWGKGLTRGSSDIPDFVASKICCRYR